MRHLLSAAVHDVQTKRIDRLERDMRTIAEIAEHNNEPVIAMVARRAEANAPELPSFEEELKKWRRVPACVRCGERAVTVVVVGECLREYRCSACGFIEVIDSSG